MIIDVHSHIWPSRSQLGRAEGFSCLACPQITSSSPQDHLAAAELAEVVFVLGFVSEHLDAHIPNDLISNYLADHPGRLIGFAGVDPTAADCLDQVRRFHDGRVFAGLTLSPPCQGFHPTDTRAMMLYELAQQLSIPLYFLQGEVLPSQAMLEYAQPALIDEVARTCPDLKIVISHLGYPWIDQTVALLAKHPNVYADLAGLTNRPWHAYRSLTLAHEYRVTGKLLFASDFPSCTVKNAVEALYNLNKIALDSSLPAVPREKIRAIIERDSLSLLGLSPVSSAAPVTAQET